MQNSKKVCTGGPHVLHAHNIYTLKVFGLFSQLKEESEFYRAMEVIPGEEYIAEHYDLSRVQRWCKGRYRVQAPCAGTKCVRVWAIRAFWFTLQLYITGTALDSVSILANTVRIQFMPVCYTEHVLTSRRF